MSEKSKRKFDNPSDVFAFLEAEDKRGRPKDLEALTALIADLGSPDRAMKSIHLVGTNGKGSTGAFLVSLLQSEGYRVGHFSSPHLVSYRERIQVDGVPIPMVDLMATLERIEQVREEVQRPMPTYFCYSLLIALDYFCKAGVDMMVLEAGVGGKGDATSVVANRILTVITPIALDHQGALGDTLEAIAANKSGGILPRSTVISAHQDPVVAKVIERIAVERGATLKVLPADGVEILMRHRRGQRFALGGKVYDLNMLGDHQSENAALALEAYRSIAPMGTRAGEAIALSRTRWPGRLQWLSDLPPVLVDGAHNEHGLAGLCETIAHYDLAPFVLVMGYMADKSRGGQLARLISTAEAVVYTSADDPRANRDFEGGEGIYVTSRLVEAMDIGYDLQRQKPDRIILVAGSLYLVGEAMDLIQPR